MSTDSTRNATTPCQTCDYADHCRQGEYSCAAFSAYVNRRSWKRLKREPSRDEYAKLFSARDAA